MLVLGDSIGAAYGMAPERGWVALLEARLAARDPAVGVVNASVSGETTGGGLARLPAALDRHDPMVLIIELGGNDGLRGYPLGRLRANLERLVRLGQASGARVLLLGMRIPPNYGARYADGFSNSFGLVAEATAVPLVPFLLEGFATEAALMQEDGIHPTEAAQPLMADLVWAALAPLLEALEPAGSAGAPPDPT